MNDAPNKKLFNYLYMIHEVDDITSNIVKNGRTTREANYRFNDYPKNIIIITYHMVDDCIKRKTELIEIFKIKFKLAKGREYFTGNVKDMKTEFNNFCNIFDVDFSIKEDI